jgi:hypothetical protein
MLLRHIAGHTSGNQDPGLVAEFELHAAESEHRAEQLSALLREQEPPLDPAAGAAAADAEK